ncbi:FO synthase [Actinoplanes sp. NPDC023714]|uniref:FO synthase n=1 Tax=Actinoplanes sp. NPDC023714 TaxID=3154322 RepID=UPI0033E9C7AE
MTITDAEAVELLGADGADLEDLCARADALRRDLVGDEITFVVNRNLDTARVGASPGLVRDLAAEAAALGATEICMQGPLPAGLPGEGYLDLIRTIATAAPGIHLHAFRPPEVADAAERMGVTPKEFLERAREAGLGSVPGTAAKILDDDVRTRLNGGPDMPVERWVELITTAHEAGLTSTATMLYGHVETPAQQVAHLRLLASIAERTRGFTEFIAMPFQPLSSVRGTRALTAVARLILAGRIDHIQAPWPKVGRELTIQLLRGGADDLGGLLLDGVLDPSAGQEQGLSLTREDVAAIGAELGRPVRQRTTRYGAA